MRQRTILLMVIMAVVLEAAEAPGYKCPESPPPKVALERPDVVSTEEIQQVYSDVSAEEVKQPLQKAIVLDTLGPWRASEALGKLGVKEGAVDRKKIRKAPAQAVESNKPIAHWAFEEGRGSKVYDWAANNDGIVHGAKWTTGRVGGALSFDGVNDYVDCGNDPVFDITGPITLMAWLKTSSGSSVWQGIVTKGEVLWKIQKHVSGSGDFECWGLIGAPPPGPYLSTVGVNMNDGQWHHIAGTYDGAAMRIYWDGVLNNSFSVSGTINTGSDPVYIGGVYGKPEYGFPGIIDEVAIYNRALSAEEIRQLYQHGSPDQVKQFPRKPAESSASLVTMTALGVMFEFRPPAGSSGWIDMELYEHGGEMLAAFSCPHAGEPIQIWLAEPVDQNDPAKYYLRYRIRITAAPLPKWRVIGVSRMPKTTNKTSGSDSGQAQQKPPEPKNVSTSEELPIAGLLPHGKVKDGLAAFLLCHRARFKVGQPIPLTYGIINIGSALQWETNLREAEKNAKLKTRIWWLGNNPELQYNYSWFEITGPDGNNVRYRGGTGTLPNYTAAVVDKYSVVLYHRQFVGKHYPDLRGPLASDPKHLRHYFDLTEPGTYKVRWGYSPWWKVGPWTGELMSNEVQFEIVP